MPKDKDWSLAYRTQLTALLAGYPDSPKTPTLLPMGAQLSPYGSKNHLLLNGNVNQCAMATPTGVCTPTQKYMQLHNAGYQPRQVPSMNGGSGSINNINNTTNNNSNNCNNNNNNNNYLQVPGAALLKVPQHAGTLPPTMGVSLSPRNSCSQNTSGYQSFSSSTTSLEQAYPPYAQLQAAVSSTSSSSGGCVPRTHYSPDSTYSSEAGSIPAAARLGRRLSDGVLLGLGSATGGAHLLPGSAESYRSLHYELAAAAGKQQQHQQQQRAFDFDLKRAIGFKAMERTPVAGELRTPTPAWLGMGLSRTSPAPLETVDDGGATGPNGWRMPPPPGLGSPYGISATTGLLDATPVNRRMQLSQHKDIHTLLTSVGLEHYISKHAKMTGCFKGLSIVLFYWAIHMFIIFLKIIANYF